MKTTAFILSIYVFCLAVLPILGTIGSLQELICCTDSCTKEQQVHHDEDKECQEICNPFLSCHCCSGFTPMLIEAENDSNLEVYSDGTTQAKTLFPSQFISSVWHPPKV